MLNPTEADERRYLKSVLEFIDDMILGIDAFIHQQVKDMKAFKEYLWENLSELDRAEKSATRNYVTQAAMSAEETENTKRRLKRMKLVPYFGRIDFRADGEDEASSLYVGIHSLYDSKSKRNLIYDWRAPISTMFYDFDFGKAYYQSPVGRIDGMIEFKRQFRIRNSIMEFMIQNSINIDDELLQKELSTTSDERMKNIVATIQREQNAIIRDEESHNLIIQGVAGSGKTSIALHRVAYILYRFKGQITSDDILIISPNKVFADYISNVLPELGEETIKECGMEELLSELLDGKVKFQTFFEQVNDLLENKNAATIERTKFKATFEFVQLLDKYLVHLENTCFQPEDIVVGIIPVAKEWILEKFHSHDRLPIRQRLELIANDIKNEFKISFRRILTTEEMRKVRAELKKMLHLGSDAAVYKDMYEWLGKPEYLKKTKDKKMEYADVAPMIYLKISLEGVKTKSSVKHLLVDEMQDYSPVQYRLLSKIFPCKKTILGDAAQNVNPYSSTTADDIRKALYKAEIMKLNKSYRSGYEITELAKSISGNSEIDVVERHTEKPQLIEVSSREAESQLMREMIMEVDVNNPTSTAYIFKLEKDAIAFFESLGELQKRATLLVSGCQAFTNGIVVTTSHMAKGLEFDEVVIPNVTKANYNDEMDKSLLYIACTRAMHRLKMIFCEEHTEFINNALCISKKK